MIALIAAAIVATNGPGPIVVTPSPSRSKAARSVRLAPEQMFALAEMAHRKGDLATEAAVYTALEANPDPDIRSEAWFRHARHLAELKRYREAALLLRHVVDEKPNAVAPRLELAQALQALGDPNGALRQLRAAQSAGLPADVARLVDRFSTALRAEQPIGASLEVALAPDSNINRATRSDTLGTILGNFRIGDEGKAKSGVGLSVTGQAFRRFPIASDTNILLRLSGAADLYRRSRFNDVAVDLAAGPELSFGRDRVQAEIGATQRFFGKKPYLRSERIAATVSHPIGSLALLRVTGSAALVDNRLNDLQDGKSYSGRLQVERALTPTTGLVAGVSASREALRDPAYSTIGWRAEFTGWHDVGRTTVTAGVEFGRLQADARLALFAERRQDRYFRLSAAASLRQIQFRGFAPVLRWSFERNRSSIAFYDYRRSRTEIAIVHAF